MKREDSVSSVVLSTALVSLTLTKHYWVQYSKIFSWARARRGSGRVNGDSALKQPAPACCTSKKRRNATASSSSRLSYKTRAAHAPRQAKQVQTRTGRHTWSFKADVLAFIYRTFFFFGIFNAVLKSYTKLLFMQVVACSRDLCQGMRRISKIGVIFILELLAPKDITGQTLKIMPKICNEQAW